MTIETFKKAETVVRKIESLQQAIEELQDMQEREDMPYEIQFKYDGSKGKDNEYRYEYIIQGPHSDNRVNEVPKAKEFRKFIAALVQNYETRLDQAKIDLEQI